MALPTGSSGLKPAAERVSYLYTAACDIPSSVADSGVFTGLDAGTYTVHIEDINDCFRDTTVVITEPDAFILQQITVDSLQCSGDADGIITITAQGGKLPYTYWITPGTEINNDGILIISARKTTSSVSSTPAPAVIHSLRYHPDGCTFTPGHDSVTVDPILCNDGRATIIIHVSGGTQPYEGSLDGGVTFGGRPVLH